MRKGLAAAGFVIACATPVVWSIAHAQGGGGVAPIPTFGNPAPTQGQPPLPAGSIAPIPKPTSVTTVAPTIGSAAPSTPTAAAGTGTVAPIPGSSSTATTTAAPTSEDSGAIAAPPKPHYDLKTLIAMADAHNAQVKMSLDRLAQAHAQLDEIKWIPWSQFSVTGGLAMVPEIRGTSVYSPNADISLSSKLGPAWRITVEGVIPIYTFGKISSANAAAEALVDVAAADVERFKRLVHHDVRRAYFGLMLAHDARYLLDKAQSRLADAIETAEDKEDADEADLLRMKTYHAEVKARLGEVEKGERVAAAGLRFLAGFPDGAPVDVPDEPISPPRKPLVDVVVYLAAARIHRPEVKMVKAGIEARSAQVDLAKARLYPDIGLGFSFGYANAPIIADQTNPFILDNANYLRYGAGIVFKWNLDLMPASARVHYAEAQLAELRDTEKYALGGVGVEVETAYAAAQDAATREKAYGEAESLAKRWVATVSAGISIGTKEDKDIIDPLRSFLTNRYNHLQAIMDLDVAISQLSLATGDESVAEY
jgi:outer membrane protein TolC